MSGLLGFTVVFALMPPIIRIARRGDLGRRITDLHHTHKGYVPRVGGLALAVAFLVTELFVALFFPSERAATPGRNVVVLSSLAIFALGFLDDLKPLGAKRKLGGQVLIALSVWVCGIGIEGFQLPFTDHHLQLHGWSALVTVLWLVGMTNLINLIDGIDGLAGGISLMLMGLLAYIGHQSGHFELLAAGMAGALLGFLRFNFPPARVYLGDGGAYFLGFQIGLFSLVNSHKGTIFAALVAPLFVLALPILDTTLAIVRRGLQGLPIFRPDRRHIHHRLMKLGFSRRQVVLWSYGFTLVFLAMGLTAFWSRGKLVPALLGLGVLLLLICAGHLRFSRDWFAVGRVVGNSLEMRQEIHYALSLTRWFGMEGRRCNSVQMLWDDLVFSARKLGFTALKLKLADSEKVWVDQTAAPTKTFTHEVQGGRLGTLELGVALTDTADTNGDPEDSTDKLYEILSELLAEGWTKAAAEWHGNASTALRFDSSATTGANGARRSARAFFFATPRSRVLPRDLPGAARQVKI
jgi:UDP-GlcNAc:undecaprenyl-phosphate GlcNAc-1-phosphate transferase